MESGKGIEQRDSRIARVKTRNGSSGAQISFQFKNGVPGYKVRLRKDYVEILISAEGSNSSTAAKSSTSAGSGKSASKKRKKTKKDAASKAQATSTKTGDKKPKKKPKKKTDD
jgi:hypothetical protein